MMAILRRWPLFLMNLLVATFLMIVLVHGLKHEGQSGWTYVLAAFILANIVSALTAALVKVQSIR